MQKRIGYDLDNDDVDMNTMNTMNTMNRLVGSPLSDGGRRRLVFTVKLQKQGMEVERPATPVEDQDAIGMGSSLNKPVEEGKGVCLVCKKEFSSGKALGGHMRIHDVKNPNCLQKVKKSRKVKRSEKNGKPDYTNCVNDEGEPTCALCDKTFPSVKSLFGHMRCHPGRDWRGIQPPPHATATATVTNHTNTTTKIPGSLFGKKANNNSPASASSTYSSENNLSFNGGGGGGGDQVVDLLKYVSPWPVTERRGRVPKKVKRAIDAGLLEAAEDLMNFANGARNSMLESGSNSPPSTGIGKGKAVMVEENQETETTLPAKWELGYANYANFSNNEQLLISPNHKNNSANVTPTPYKISPDQKIKKRKLMTEFDLNKPVVTVTPVVTDWKYKCTTCNKSFTTHQALGGHRSSHNKSKLTSTDHAHIEPQLSYESFHVNQPSENLEKGSEFTGGFAGGVFLTGVINSTSIHQCKVYEKVFATGQALGGHQRCHWIGTIGTNGTNEGQAQAPSSHGQITSTGEGASQTGSGQKVLGFDLNMLPDMTEEDELAANVNGNEYAS